jgi:hypothetical protein
MAVGLMAVGLMAVSQSWGSGLWMCVGWVLGASTAYRLLRAEYKVLSTEYFEPRAENQMAPY